MSRSGVRSGTDDVAAPVRPELAAAGRRWAVPEFPRLPVPVTGAVIFAGIRVLSVAVGALALRQGKFSDRHWSLVRWMRAADGGHYLAIAANIAGLSNAGYVTFRDEIQRQYQVRQVDTDFYLYITPNCGTNTAARNFCGVFNAQALGLDLRRGLKIAPQRDESARLLELNATIWYGAGLIQPTFGIQIIGTVLAAPNN